MYWLETGRFRAGPSAVKLESLTYLVRIPSFSARFSYFPFFVKNRLVARISFSTICRIDQNGTECGVDRLAW